jgi:hypothetical protein
MSRAQASALSPPKGHPRPQLHAKFLESPGAGFLGALSALLRGYKMSG